MSTLQQTPAVTGTAPAALTVDQLRDIAGSVPDPEIPVLTLYDLGILRDVQIAPDGTVDVTLTPTYTGCPATAVIAADVETAGEQTPQRKTYIGEILNHYYAKGSGARALLEANGWL